MKVYFDEGDAFVREFNLRAKSHEIVDVPDAIGTQLVDRYRWKKYNAKIKTKGED